MDVAVLAFKSGWAHGALEYGAVMEHGVLAGDVDRALAGLVALGIPRGASAADAVDEAGSAGLGARAPCVPSADLTVDGAGTISALTVFSVGTAGLAAVLGFGLGAGACVAAGTAGDGALSPGSPGVDFLAVDGARLSVAVTSLLGGRAGLAARSGGKEVASADLVAAVARGRARFPGSPGRDFTISRAGVVVAGASFRQLGAGSATSDGSADHGAGTGLLAAATSDRASGPGLPIGYGAVSRAGVGVASAGLSRSFAGLATEGGLGEGAGTLLGAGFARGSARGPCGPSTSVAIDGALVGVAGAVVDVVGAALATSNGGKSGAGAGLDASAARGGAAGPGGPSFDFAVNGASVGVAFTGVSGRRACIATSGGRNKIAGAGLGAGAARLAAHRPGLPAANVAVHGASVVVALTLFGEVVALLAAEGRSEGERALAGLGALAARLGAAGPGFPIA